MEVQYDMLRIYFGIVILSIVSGEISNLNASTEVEREGLCTTHIRDRAMSSVGQHTGNT